MNQFSLIILLKIFLIVSLLFLNCKKKEQNAVKEEIKNSNPETKTTNENKPPIKATYTGNETKAFIIASELSLRQTPTKTAERITLIPFGTVVDIIEESENLDTIDNKTAKWLKVKFEEQEGWAFGGYAFRMNEQNLDEIDEKRWEKVEKDFLKPTFKTSRFPGSLANTTWKGKESVGKCGSEGITINKKIVFRIQEGNRFETEFKETHYDTQENVEEGSGKYQVTKTGIILNFSKRVLKKYIEYYVNSEWKFDSQIDIPDRTLILDYYPEINGFIEANHKFLNQDSVYYEKTKGFLATKEDMLEYTPCMEANILFWRDGYVSELFPFQKE